MSIIVLNLLIFKTTFADDLNGKGDVNKDGIVNITDVIILARYIVDKESNISNEDLLLGDMNNDGHIRMNDVMKIIHGIVSEGLMVEVTNISFNEPKDTVYLNESTEAINYNVTITPSNATDKSIVWTSSDTSVATINNGKVTPVGLGTTTLTATASNGITANYSITVKAKVIVFIQASQGERMNNWYKTHVSSLTGFTYADTNHTLIHHFIPGSGICFQTSLNGIGNKSEDVNETFDCLSADDDDSGVPGTVGAINKLKTYFGNKTSYLEVYLFYALSGNSSKTLSCDEITLKYPATAELYSRAVNRFSEEFDVMAYVVSIYPADVAEAQAAGKDYYVSSTNAHACDGGKVSVYKRYVANNITRNAINNYNNLTFLDIYSEYFTLVDPDTHKMEWKNCLNSSGTIVSCKNVFNTTDGQHMDQATTKDYAPRVFNAAGL